MNQTLLNHDSGRGKIHDHLVTTTGYFKGSNEVCATLIELPLFFDTDDMLQVAMMLQNQPFNEILVYFDWMNWGEHIQTDQIGAINSFLTLLAALPYNQFPGWSNHVLFLAMVPENTTFTRTDFQNMIRPNALRENIFSMEAVRNVIFS